MKPETITDRNLKIDGMSGDACVQKVTDAIKSVHDVSARSVKVGTATINADQTGCDTACTAIANAGFKARECDGDANGMSRETSESSLDQRGDHQPSAAPIGFKAGERVANGDAQASRRPNGTTSA